LMYHHERDEQQQPASLAVRPDKYSYAMVARAWVDSQSLEAPDRCRALLEQARKYASEDDKPDTVMCNTVLNAYALHSRPDEAQELLDAMILGEDDLHPPDHISFNSCLKAWSNSNHPEALTKCTALMKRLQELKLFRRERWLAPNTNTYYHLIDAHIKRGKLSEAASLYLEMVAAPRTDAVHHKLLDQLCFALAKSNAKEYPNAPEQILRLMDDIQITAQKNGKGSVRLDVAAYNALIEAYGNRGQAHEAEQVLAELWEKHPKGPDRRSFNGVVKAWSTSQVGKTEEQDDEDLTRCEQLVDRMDQLADREGRRDLRPDTYTYKALLTAYAVRGMGREAQELFDSPKLEEMMNNRSSDRNRVSRLYELVLKAWAASSPEHNSEAPDRCLELLERMEKAGNVKPSPLSYNRVLVALVNHGRVQEAEELLMSSSSRNWKPDFHSYNIILGGWSRKPNSTAQCQQFWNKLTAAWSEQKSEEEHQRHHSSSTWQLYPNAVSLNGDEFVFDRNAQEKVWKHNSKEAVWQQEDPVSSKSWQVLLSETLNTLGVPYGALSNHWREWCT